MQSSKRTKTLEQCEAEALLLGATYHLSTHTYYISFRATFDEDGSLIYKRPGLTGYVCAETLQPVPRSELYERAQSYASEQKSEGRGGM